MSGPIETKLLLALAIPDPRKRLVALRALLPKLTGAPRRRAEAAMRETEALIASLGPSLKMGRGKSGRAGSPPRGPKAKTAAKKAAPAKTAPVKRAAAKKAPAKEAPVKRAAAKEAPVKKAAAAAKKAPAKKAPAKKFPTRKRVRLPPRPAPLDPISPDARVGRGDLDEPAPGPPAKWLPIDREVTGDYIHLPRRLDDARRDDEVDTPILAPDARSLDDVLPGVPPSASRGVDQVVSARPRTLEDDDDSPEHPAVSLGLSAADGAEVPLPLDRTLAVNQPCFFWLEIGAPVAGSATEQPVTLPVELLPAQVDLDIVVFAAASSFTVPAGVGRIRVSANTIRVTQTVSRPAVPAEMLAHRLFFAITAPSQPGEHHLSCHLYYQGTLVQSHDLAVTVAAARSVLGRRAIISRMDYTLSTRLTRDSLAGFAPHQLSIATGAAQPAVAASPTAEATTTAAPAGSHGFWFSAGRGEFHREARFDGLEVQDLIDRARRAFRNVSWGTTTPWKSDLAYRYQQSAGFAQLTADLAQLAIAGYRNYDVLIARLGGDAEALAERMRAPGVIQLALKESARLVLPIALVYDYRLDVDGRVADYTLCDQFRQPIDDLERHPCFVGHCPNRDRPSNRTVCPSGFWGFRHEIGVPPTLGTTRGTPADLPAVLVCPGTPTAVVAVTADPTMQERDDHLRNLRQLLAAPELPVAETRARAIELLRGGGAHLVYFYCHGGVDDDAPYLQIGAPPDRISRATLRSERVQWDAPRSLVFVNGCHTTDLEPERAIDLVTGFIQTARSSGVIGTEITVFEPLATAFAEAFIARLVERRTVGAAIRLARLALLQRDLNPLGLLYVPFAMASLRLSPAAA